MAYSSAHSTSTYTRLRDPAHILIARLLWVACAAFIMWGVISAIPSRYERTYDRWLATVENPALGLGQYRPTAQNTARLYTALETITVTAYLGLCVFIFLRRSDDWMAMVVPLFLLLVAVAANELLFLNRDPGWWFIARILTVITGGGGVFFLLIFPDGRIRPYRMRWLIPVAFIWETFRVFYLRDQGEFTFIITYMITLSMIIAAIGAQVWRFRNESTPMERQQTKWVILGVATFLVGQVFQVTLLEVVLVRSTGLTLLIGEVVIRPLVINGTLLVLFLSFTFSLLRYRLWNVDFVINRGLVYAGITLILGAVFFLQFIVLQLALTALMGQDESAIAIAVSAALTAGLFNPTRKRVQLIIDQRFFKLRVGLDQAARLRATGPITSPGAFSGRVLGDYILGDVIGHGGMGEVYSAQHPREDRKVAIKLLQTNVGDHAEMVARFHREAMTVSALSHPGIVRIYDYGEQESVCYMVMEFIDGEPLSAALKRGALPPDQVIAIISDIAAALDYVHEHGLVHRDVKPSNVMLRVRSDGTLQAVLMDFGIARIVGSGTALTKTGGTVGTLDYMAPEQIMSAREVDSRADIYALGIMTYQCLTGDLPFRSSNPGHVLFAHLQQPAPDPRIAAPHISEDIALAVLRALAKNPQDRFPQAGDFAQAMQGAPVNFRITYSMHTITP